MEEQTYVPFIQPDAPPSTSLTCNECSDTSTICPPCERVFDNKEEMYAIIQEEFNAELMTRYNAEYDTEDETGTLIKIRRLTETYVALFKKNVLLTPKTQSIIDHCEEFILKVKDRIREVCEHTIEEDDVEVGIDRIVHIIYCNRCETLFN